MRHLIGNTIAILVFALVSGVGGCGTVTGGDDGKTIKKYVDLGGVEQGDLDGREGQNVVISGVLLDSEPKGLPKLYSDSQKTEWVLVGGLDRVKNWRSYIGQKIAIIGQVYVYKPQSTGGVPRQDYGSPVKVLGVEFIKTDDSILYAE